MRQLSKVYRYHTHPTQIPKMQGELCRLLNTTFTVNNVKIMQLCIVGKPISSSLKQERLITGWKVEQGKIHLGIWRAGNTPKYVRPKKEKKNEKGLSFCKVRNILSCAILKQKLKKNGLPRCTVGKTAKNSQSDSQSVRYSVSQSVKSVSQSVRQLINHSVQSV